MNNKLKSVLDLLILPLIFWVVAVVLWQSKDNIFYLFNFGYIGTAILIGSGLYNVLPNKKKPLGRKVTQLLIGVYMLVFLGLFNSENMQIEGFFFYLLTGVFAAATLHYTIAKIVGPLVFNRGWCGWACWTAMVLDFLPYSKSPGRIDQKWEWLRYGHFAASLGLVLLLWFGFDYRLQRETTELYWLVIGNLLYFAIGIVLALYLRDNRAFCKYVCPITVLLKIGACFALLKITGSSDKCTECGACTRNCPMDIRIPEYIKHGQRVLSTECIFCQTCVNVCPTQALSYSFRCDAGGKELLKIRQE